MKPSTHERITALAVEIGAQSGNGGLARLFNDPAFRPGVIEGVVLEDAPTLSRLLNWHFHPTNETLRRKIWAIVEPNSRPLLARRQERFLEACQGHPASNPYLLLGRIIHHIQDMSTPSHVVPVYHGPGLDDPYEDYLEVRWDDIQSCARTRVRTLQHDAPPPAHDFLGLYDRAAQVTLLWLDADRRCIEVVVDDQIDYASGALFWAGHEQTFAEPPPYHSRGFGGFGPMGRQFGNGAEVVIGTHRHRVRDASYLEVATHFVTQALEDTLAAMRLGAACLAGEPLPT
ncbi:MAG TPA: hypothetical protein PLW81_02870 [Thiobacillaceae bacterium]|nr:hypothetical protein [Thiobacillaceae bacterium]